MSPVSSKKSPRRLVLGRETLRVLAAPASSMHAVLVHTSCGVECSCPATVAGDPTIDTQTSY
jgi:hypothetical protein